MRIWHGLVILGIGGAVCHHYDLFNRISLSDLGRLADQAKSWTQEQLPRDPIFKDSTTLTDSSGRQLECQVLARRGATIAIRRNSDQREFLIPLGYLSPEDQARFSEVEDYRPEVIQALEGGGPAVAANRHARWNSSLDQALGEARNTGLPIYLLFTGTDW